MKKIAAFLFVFMVVLFCSGASVWEGAAAVSLNGELPDEGYYAATKSFPRNTVVDVTNLETGRTIRVIVAASLDSPGLLAILSRDTARAIGLQNRSIGRIRMTMPSDPIAFSRFNQNGENTGDPDFDPRAALAAAGLSDYSAEQPSYAVEAPVERAEPSPDPAAFLPEEAPPEPAAEPASPSRPRVPPNPAAADLIVDLPRAEGSAETAARSPEPFDYSSYGWTYPLANVAEAYPPEEYAYPEESAPPEGYAAETAEAPAETGGQRIAAADFPRETPVDTRQEGPGSPPPIDQGPANIQYQPAQTEYAPEPSGGRLYLPDSPYAPAPPPLPPDRRITLVPADQRVPEYLFEGLPEGLELAPPQRHSYDEGTEQEVVIPGELIIPPIPERRISGTQAPPPLPPLEPVVPPIQRGTEAPPPRREYEPDPNSFVAAPVRRAPETAASRAKPETAAVESAPVEDSPQSALPVNAAESAAAPSRAPAPARSPGFSAPVIRELERGKYYLQIASYTREDLAAAELAKLGTAYPVTVQTQGAAPYRILIGPVNRGESAALLENFRTKGYRDAFVRHN